MVEMTIGAPEHDYLFGTKVTNKTEWRTKHNVAIFANETEFYDNREN